MARTINKSIVESTICVLDPSIKFEIDENGMPIANRFIDVSGAPSMNAARIKAQKAFGKNVMVIEVRTDESKIQLDPKTFYGCSFEVKDGETLTRDYVSQTFKFTRIMGYASDMKTGMLAPFTLLYFGVTTDSKLHNFACESLDSSNVCIASKEVVEERRAMERNKYLKLAAGENLEDNE